MDVGALLNVILAAVVSLLTVLFTLRAQNRKLNAEASRAEQETETTQNGDLRATNAQLVQDNQRLRDNLRQFDDELRKIRTEMAAMRREYDAEIAKLRAENASAQRKFEKERRSLYKGIKTLVRQLSEHGLEPCWMPEAEEDLV